MTMPGTETAVRREIDVEADPQRAFEVFTAGFDRWWPRAHHLGDAELDVVVIEPEEGGRWYERGADGRECVWGRVLAWEPPHRLVLSWGISGDFELEADPAAASEVEVTFRAAGAGTHVVLEHRHLERHGATAEALRAGVSAEGGWSTLLERFAAEVAR